MDSEINKDGGKRYYYNRVHEKFVLIEKTTRNGDETGLLPKYATIKKLVSHIFKVHAH